MHPALMIVLIAEHVRELARRTRLAWRHLDPGAAPPGGVQAADVLRSAHRRRSPAALGFVS